MEELVALCKRRGFIFQSNEIYGGLQGSYDYGPLGVELKNNIKSAWWSSMIYENDNIEGLDASILTNPLVLKHSGHESTFSDPMVDCKNCQARWRADQLPSEKCPSCGSSELTDPRPFNLMFKTNIGPVETEDSFAYLRPETAQQIFTNFKNVVDSSSKSLPFGIAQIGKAFRNEITPRNFIFRVREFEQMELEYFVKPGSDEDIHNEWVEKRLNWWEKQGVSRSQIELYEVPDDELAHYASKTVDIEFLYPWGWGEIEGIANRGTFDLSSHEKASGKDLSYFDPETNEKIIPTVIEPAGGLTRTLFALLCSSYDEDEVNDTTRTIFRFEFDIAPIQIGILPLSKKDELIEVSNDIKNLLQESYRTEIDVTQSIGKRYRRQDEIGTPYCITVDFETLDDKSVTIRNRDSMEQERVAITDLLDFFSDI